MYARFAPAALAALLLCPPLRAERVLTLDELLCRVEGGNPELAALQAACERADAEVRLAARPADPTLEVEAEEFGGSGDRKGFSAAEYGVRLVQPLEPGGARRTRAAVAEAARDLARHAARRRRAELLAEARGAFLAAVAAQERSRLAAAGRDLAGEFADLVERQVQGGKSAPPDALKAQARAAAAAARAARAQAAEAGARARLATLWGGGGEAEYDRLDGRLDELPEPVAWAVARGRQERSAAAAERAAELERARREARAEQAGLAPTVEAGAGWRHFAETGDQAWSASVAVPLPLWRRPGLVRSAARLRVAQAEAELLARQTAARAELAAACHAAGAARSAADALRQRALPAAESACTAALAGYRQGKFGYLEVLDAHELLIETRGAVVDALEEAHQRTAEVEKLSGGPDTKREGVVP